MNGPQRIVLALAIAGLLAATLRATEQMFMTLDALALTAIIGWTAYTVFRKENWQREARRAARGRARGVCHCGYNLTGNESGTCPECGQRIG